MSVARIDSVLLVVWLFLPSPVFVCLVRINSAAEPNALHERAAADHADFCADLARRELTWQRPFQTSLDSSEAPRYQWFFVGLLNVSFNCLDRHLRERGDKAAILFEGENGDIRRISYAELHKDVCRFANALTALGIVKGDRVVIYMPMIPEAIVAMQACARIGAIHSVVFGGFSADSLKDRIEDAGAKLLITADGGNRGGKIVELKQAADKALSHGCATIENVVVCKRTGHAVVMQTGRDLWWSDVIADQAEHCEAVWVESEHPLFLLYTSGSTGKPKGIQHSSAGYLLGSIVTMQWVFDFRDDDVFWCTADVGWVTGHSYGAGGPLACGATVVVYEGSPAVPNAGRFWKVSQDHQVTIFYTAPTAIRALMKHGDDIPAQYDKTKKHQHNSEDEPNNQKTKKKNYRVIGGERCPFVDTWWQTETGAHMIAPIPGVLPTKPGSCTRPLPGVVADVVDARGNSDAAPDKGGYLVIKQPWPSMLRTIWGNHERYIETYWGKFGGQYYLAGDSARRDQDGYFWIMGRIDDVLNVAGHRLGTMEVESALGAHPRVAEAAVVGRPDEIKGEAIFAYVVLRGERPPHGVD